MIQISLDKINKNYGFSKLLDNFSFVLNDHERVGLIGCNGCGKTTILRMIMGFESIDSGNINTKKDIKIGYLCQIPPCEKDGVTSNEMFLRGVKDLLTLEKKIGDYTLNMDSSMRSIKELAKMQEEFRIKGGYALNEKINKIKNGFKLSDELLNTEYNSLSGGEKTLINLSSLMLSENDVLLLDEPTNHLDIETLEWFEEYLLSYKGSVIIVSHDRYFLDKVVNKIVFINNGQEDIYYGNYSYYLVESEKRFMLEFQNYKNQQKMIKSIKEAIERLKEWGRRSDNPIFFRRAASMQKRLDKLELIDKPLTKKDLPIKLEFNDRSSNNVLSIKEMDLYIGSKELLTKSSMDIYLHEKVCLMGKNGTGKTTLIKNILNNTHDNIKLGTNIKIGYIPQEIRFDNEELTVYEHMRSVFVGSESDLRSKLFQFYFCDDSISKKLKTLSGGEKVRIKLLELILLESNFLILDEPTNHIDIDTKEVIENALLDYDGTLLFISHDRYFINKICTKIVRIENKKLISYNGNYDYVKEKEKKVAIIKPIKKEIKINGSNRLKEFIRECKIEELTTSSPSKNIYKIKKKSKTFYLKIDDHLSDETIRLNYLSDKISVPEVVFYEKYNGKSYLLTKALNGEMLNSEHFVSNPTEGINIIVEVFNHLYNIDYSDCVIDETIDVKLKRIESKLMHIDEKNIDEEYIKRFCTKEAMFKYLCGNKPKQIISFSHGNMSLENIFVSGNNFSGLLDIDEAGISDIYYDIVMCEISIEKNYGNSYVSKFYEALGIEKDEFKSDYYRIMNQLKCI